MPSPSESGFEARCAATCQRTRSMLLTEFAPAGDVSDTPQGTPRQFAAGSEKNPTEDFSAIGHDRAPLGVDVVSPGPPERAARFALADGMRETEVVAQFVGGDKRPGVGQLRGVDAITPPVTAGELPAQVRAPASPRRAAPWPFPGMEAQRQIGTVLFEQVQKIGVGRTT